MTLARQHVDAAGMRRTVIRMYSYQTGPRPELDGDGREEGPFLLAHAALIFGTVAALTASLQVAVVTLVLGHTHLRRHAGRPAGDRRIARAGLALGYLAAALSPFA